MTPDQWRKLVLKNIHSPEGLALLSLALNEAGAVTSELSDAERDALVRKKDEIAAAIRPWAKDKAALPNVVWRTEPHLPDGSSTTVEALGGQGILSGKDINDFKAGVRQVYDLMADGGWHNHKEIKRAAGGDYEAAQGDRRMRELRSYGFIIEKRKVKEDRRTWEYRLTNPVAVVKQM
jgi:hypothetical protein